MSSFWYGWMSCTILYSVLQITGIGTQSMKQMGWMFIIYASLAVAWYIGMKYLSQWLNRKDGK